MQRPFNDGNDGCHISTSPFKKVSILFLTPSLAFRCILNANHTSSFNRKTLLHTSPPFDAPCIGTSWYTYLYPIDFYFLFRAFFLLQLVRTVAENIIMEEICYRTVNRGKPIVCMKQLIEWCCYEQKIYKNHRWSYNLMLFKMFHLKNVPFEIFDSFHRPTRPDPFKFGDVL